MRLEAFTPTFRSHEGLHPDRNIQVYDASIAAEFSFLSRLNYLLQPYFSSLHEDYINSGTPIIRYPKLFEYNGLDQDLLSFRIGNDLQIAFTDKPLPQNDKWINLEHLIPKNFIHQLDFPKGEFIHIMIRKNTNLTRKITRFLQAELNP